MYVYMYNSASQKAHDNGKFLHMQFEILGNYKCEYLQGLLKGPGNVIYRIHMAPAAGKDLKTEWAHCHKVQGILKLI